MHPPLDPESSENILNDALSFFGGPTAPESDSVQYGPLILTVAPKEGKANTLLADCLFSPAFFLAERVERKLLTAPGSTVIELGAGAALPSLLLATQQDPPSLVVVTDYPDDGILGNLRQNVDRNKIHLNPLCTVHCAGYAWGTDAQRLLDLLPDPDRGFDVVILSDLLHFDSFHDILLDSVTYLLSKSPTARLCVAAGNYTLPRVCDSFFSKAKDRRLIFEEVLSQSDERQWLGTLEVSGLDREALSLRKAACRHWIGRWQLA